MLTGRLNIDKKLLRGLSVGLVGAALALFFWGMEWLDSLENKSWDARASWLASPGAATDNIAVILLDQHSLEWMQRENSVVWPWPRQIHGVIVNYFQRMQAQALAYDFGFYDPSFQGVEDDAMFGAAISEFGRVAMGSLSLGVSKGTTAWQPDFPVPNVSIEGLQAWLATPAGSAAVFPRAVLPIPEVGKSAKFLCNTMQNPDSDGIYRRVKLFNVFDGKIIPSLGLGAYLVAHPNVQARIAPGKLYLDEKIIPFDRYGNVILRYRGPSGTHVTYPAAAIIQSEIRLLNGEQPTIQNPNVFREKYVLFGASASALYDLRSSPVGGVYPGVEIHATVLDNLLSDDFVREIPASWVALIVIGFAMACSLLITYSHSLPRTIATCVLLLAAPVIASCVTYLNSVWLPIVVQEMAAGMTILSALVLNYATEGKQKRFIKEAFKYYLSPAVIERLILHPEQLKLGGERRILSIFFSDLQGFTSISENLDPEGLTALLNDYLSVMTDIIYEEGGTVDKYEGDAIIAFWNAPLDLPDHAIRVVCAALRCQKTLAEMRPQFYKRVGKELFMRIGINTGAAVVGNMGSHSRFNYTILGDSVNLASRLEGVNKQFGTYTMISQTTRDLLGDTYAMRELARVAVVGRKEPVTVYEPMFHDEYAARKDVLERFARGLELYYNGQFQPALDIFSAIQHLDPPAVAYIEKCHAYLAAPPENWQGVWVMTSK